MTMPDSNRAPGVAWSTDADEFVRIEDVVKIFDDTVAVKSVSLSVRRHEVFALLGSSGSGKSTLLRMLAGFEEPTSGRIYLDNQDITDLPPYRRPVNMMFQSYALFPHMTVEANVAFGLKQEGVPRKEIARRRAGGVVALPGDRKSTRLNSSHVAISYAVFCLNKKINDVMP